jgi:diguanylate cyclase (GGDEF)-like protein
MTEPRRTYLDHPRRTWRRVLVFGVICFLASVLTALLWFQDSLDEQRTSMRNAARQIQTELGHELSLRSFVVKGLEAQAASLLEGPLKVDLDFPNLLRPVPAKKGYELILPEDLDHLHFGRLTALGEIPPASSPIFREFQLAVGLSPILRAALEHDPTSPWAYYISRSGFLYLYPRVSPDEFFVTPELIDMHFRLDGKPLLTAERRVYWSKIYEDVAGKGLLATVSHPIFHGSDFIGTVSVDVSAKTLLDHIAAHTPPDINVRLLSENGADMLPETHPRGGPIDLARTPSDEVLSVDDHHIIVLPISEARWHLVLALPSHQSFRTALSATLPHALLLLFVLVSLGLVLFLARSLRRLAALSHHDSLTNLHNRRHLEEAGPIEFSRARRGLQQVALLIVDLDHFKSYNDAMGHSAGDTALRNIASRLKTTLRRDTDLLCRVGGEEFVAISPVRNDDETRALAEKLRAAVREAQLPHPNSPDGFLTASVGAITVWKDRWVTLEQAYELADKALYQSKQAGRDSVTIA